MADAEPGRQRPDVKKQLGELAGMTVGVLLVALALNLFLIPNRIAAGGVTGLATVLFHTLGTPVGVVTLAINVPLFLVGLRLVGISFGLRSVFGFVLLGLLIDLTAPLVRPLTTEPLLATVYGGGLTGLGIGITYRFGGSTGGTVLAARILWRLFGLASAHALLLLDGLVILLAGVVFNAELALYALLAVIVQTWAIDLVEEGRPHAKAAWIICRDPDTVAQLILRNLDRGVTALQGTGMYTGFERQVLLVTVSRGEVTALKELVRQQDPRAFIIITDASEVMGEGFQPV